MFHSIHFFKGAISVSSPTKQELTYFQKNSNKIFLIRPPPNWKFGSTYTTDDNLIDHLAGILKHNFHNGQFQYLERFWNNNWTSHLISDPSDRWLSSIRCEFSEVSLQLYWKWKFQKSIRRNNRFVHSALTMWEKNQRGRVVFLDVELNRNHRRRYSSSIDDRI